MGVFSQARITSDSLFALLRTLLLTIVFSLILNCHWLSELPGITMQDWVSDSGQDSALATAQNFYSHPDSPRDQLFTTPTQGRPGLGPPVPPPGLNSQHLGFSLSCGARPKPPSLRSENRRKRTGQRSSGRENGLPELEAGHLVNEEGEVGNLLVATPLRPL